MLLLAMDLKHYQASVAPSDSVEQWSMQSWGISGVSGSYPRQDKPIYRASAALQER